MFRTETGPVIQLLIGIFTVCDTRGKDGRLISVRTGSLFEKKFKNEGHDSVWTNKLLIKITEKKKKKKKKINKNKSNMNGMSYLLLGYLIQCVSLLERGSQNSNAATRERLEH